MRVPPRVVVLVMSVAFGVAAHAAAQPTGPAIHSVTVLPDTGVLTITGTSLGADLVVIVDGQPVTILPGATSTRLEVQPPATVLTTPGTYRLTVVDPVRHVGDGFVVASQGSLASGVVEAGRTPSTSSVGGASSAVSGAGVANAADNAGYRSVRAIPSPMVYEGLDNTAIGNGALAVNTTGHYSTASGAQALFRNTTGSYTRPTARMRCTRIRRVPRTRPAVKTRSSPTPAASTTRPAAEPRSTPTPRAKKTRPAIGVRSTPTPQGLSTRPPE
jgi:hypothetical protein